MFIVIFKLMDYQSQLFGGSCEIYSKIIIFLFHSQCEPSVLEFAFFYLGRAGIV